MAGDILHPIPAGTVMTQCRLCKRPIYFLEQLGGRKMAVDLTHEDAYPPSTRDDGRGTNHLQACPNAATFRERAQARAAAPEKSYG